LIASRGDYRHRLIIQRNQLTVGSNGLSTTASGPVDDSGLSLRAGASLVKTGLGTLTLSHPSNTYSGGTTLEQGTLDVAAVGAAGTGAITFADKATFKIENAALTGHAFGNPIDFFAKHDVVDLTKFHAGANAKLHRATDVVTVHSGHVTDTLTLVSTQGTHFVIAKDGHGGTKVTLAPAHVAATMASLSMQDIAGEHAAVDVAMTANHLGDFLFVV
jgi:autotransporter-associated beta strand protein